MGMAAHVVEVPVGTDHILDVGGIETELPYVLDPVFNVGRMERFDEDQTLIRHQQIARDPLDADVVEVVKHLEGLGAPLQRRVIEGVAPCLRDIAEVCRCQVRKILHRDLCLGGLEALRQ